MTTQRPLFSTVRGIRFLVRAQQFLWVGKSLPDMHGAEPNWPKLFLLMHAVELALKAFIVSRKGSAPQSHKLVSLYNLAAKCGWERDPRLEKELPHMSKLHNEYHARYPSDSIRPIELLAEFDEPIDDMVQQLIDDIEKAVDPRPRRAPQTTT
jgi:HEPN domain-containing protein